MSVSCFVTEPSIISCKGKEIVYFEYQICLCGKYTNVVLKGCDQMPVFLDDTTQKVWKHADVVLGVVFWFIVQVKNMLFDQILGISAAVGN